MKKILLLTSLFLCLLMYNDHYIKASESTNTNVKVDSTLTEQNIFMVLLRNNIKYPEVVLSQIMIETGYLKSRLCRKNNNLLGMTVPSKRETTALNESGYAKYANWFECIADYKLYQDFVFSKHTFTSKNQYIAYLQKNYAKSPNYKSRLIQLSKEYELRNPYNFMFYTTL